MNTITAIETRYKGYRFRSRLEARWAMFFDRAGIEWTYEPDPVCVAGEAYLPDFTLKINGAMFTHEVKSLHEADRIKPVKVYLAGKMSSDHEWRSAPVNYEFQISSDAPVQTRGYTELPSHSGMAWGARVHRFEMSGAHFSMTGPFALSDKHNHGAVYESAPHAAAECGGDAVDPARVLAACMQAIDRSDIVCAHISTPDAYGTLVEIGYAKAKGIPVYLTMTEGAMPPRLDGHPAAMGSHDLWFAAAAATQAAVVANAAAARAIHAALIKEMTPREYRLIGAIGNDTKRAFMSFGDPLDIITQGREHYWGGRSLRNIISPHRAAAEAVRSHRFDGR